MDSEVTYRLFSEPELRAETVKEAYQELGRQQPVELFKILFALLRREKQALRVYVLTFREMSKSQLQQDPIHLIWDYFIELGKKNRGETLPLVNRWLLMKEIQDFEIIEAALKAIRKY